jgi:hypothetical protein
VEIKRAIEGMKLFEGRSERELARKPGRGLKSNWAGKSSHPQGAEAVHFHELNSGVIKLYAARRLQEHTDYLAEDGEPFCLCTL